jgi:hypothetical protein
MAGVAGQELLFPLSDRQIGEVYDYLRLYGFKNFPSYAKFLEVLDGYWSAVLRDQLRGVRLRRGTIAGKDNFEVLRDAIVTKWIRSRCQPGVSVGGLAADALGQPVMQATLKTFHFAGLKKAGFGSTTASELVSLSPDRQSPNARVHLRRDLTFDEAYNYFVAHKVIQIGDLVLDQAYDIAVNNPPGSFAWPAWYFAALAGRAERPPADWGAALKLNLDPVALHQNHLTPAAVAQILEDALNMGGRELFCVGSPLREYTVYVLAYREVVLRNESRVMEILMRSAAPTQGVEEAAASAGGGPLRTDQVLLEEAFFGHLALARILNVYVPGDRYLAAGVGDAGVQNAAVLSAVLKEQRLGERRGRPLFRWLLNKLAPREGVTLYRLGRLLHAAGFAVRAVTDTPVSPLSPGLGEGGAASFAPPRAPASLEDDSWLEGTVGGQPTWLYHLRGMQDVRRRASIEVLAPPEAGAEGGFDYLKRIILEDGKALDAADKRSEKLGEFPFVHARANGQGLLTELASHWHFGTSQPNILDLLRHPDVDPRFTVTNQLRMSKTKVPGISEALGIAALRNYIAEEFYSTLLGSGDYIDPQHVALVADYMTCQGRPVPLTAGGFTSRETATTDEAYVDKAAARYIATASIGKEEDVSTIGSAIALGQPMPQGTGLVRPGLLSITPPAEEVGEAAPSRGYQRLRFTLEQREASVREQQERWALVAKVNATRRRPAAYSGAPAPTPAPTPAPRPAPAPIAVEQVPPAAPIRALNRRTRQALDDLLKLPSE